MGIARWTAFVSALALGLSAVSAQSDSAGGAVSGPGILAYIETDGSVELSDGRALHLVCMGVGSPTVILTAGLGDWSASWVSVQPDIARTTRVCAWDRPGFGLSDGSGSPQSAESTTRDLEQALERGRIAGPYVMVGHSLGSYESLLFADRNRDQVTGMVLVDPSITDQYARMTMAAPGAARANDAFTEGLLALIAGCAAQARGEPAPSGSAPPDCGMAYPPDYPPAVREALLARAARPGGAEAVASFARNAALSSRQVVNPARDYGSMPLVVLTATQEQPPPPGMPPEVAAEMRKFRADFEHGHHEYAALSTRGINARVPNTSHYIHQIKPQVVIDAVEAVVAEARAAREAD